MWSSSRVEKSLLLTNQLRSSLFLEDITEVALAGPIDIYFSMGQHWMAFPNVKQSCANNGCSGKWPSQLGFELHPPQDLHCTFLFSLPEKFHGQVEGAGRPAAAKCQTS